MLKLPNQPQPGDFVRQGDEIIWCGQRCAHIHTTNGEAGSTLTSLCFVHEDYAVEARKVFNAEGSLSDIFEPRRLKPLAGYNCQFVCSGLYDSNRLIGFFDVPLVWLDGRPILPVGTIHTAGFRDMLNAAKTRSAATPDRAPAATPDRTPTATPVPAPTAPVEITHVELDGELPDANRFTIIGNEDGTITCDTFETKIDEEVDMDAPLVFQALVSIE